MKNPLKSINTSLQNSIDSVSNILFEFKKTRKYEHSLKCDVIMVYPNSLGETYTGLTDESNNFLVVPLLLRIYQDLNPYYINGRKTFFISSKYHGTIDLLKVAKVSEAFYGAFKLKYVIDEKLSKFLMYNWQYADNIIDFNISDVSGTMRLDLFDNEFSGDLSTSAHRFISTKIMSFLEETPRRIFILSLCLAGVIGMLFGGIIGLCVSGIIMYFVR